MTFVERRAQRDPTVPMRTVRDVGTGEVLGHFLVPDELVERIARPIPVAQAATQPVFEPLTAEGYRRLRDSCGAA